ncbi:MAG TPA: hypothetical protein VH020_13130 [Stellaceae bacterium]|jgi:uncharacterized protein|nr:hypothetical protein [Stellaceae bacterium]
MIGFSLGKLLFLGFVLLVLWYGVKLVTRVGEVRQAVRRAAEQAPGPGGQGPRQAIATEDLVKCRGCGAFVPAKGATSCGRGDCPWPR